MSRALQRAGQESLTEEDILESSTKYRAVRDFYMQTFLLLLSEANWTELKRRKQLIEGPEENLTEYGYAYYLPIDCSRTIEIDDNDPYIIEGNILYTNVLEPVLLYVTSGKRKEYAELPEEEQEEEVYFQGKHYTWIEETFVDEDTIEPAHYEEDFVQEDEPLYEELNLSPEFMQCFEYHLAAQLSLKITGDKQLFINLIQLADSMQGKAQNTSREHGTSKQKGSVFWAEQLGLSTPEEADYVNY